MYCYKDLPYIRNGCLFAMTWAVQCNIVGAIVNLFGITRTDKLRGKNNELAWFSLV